MSEKDNKKNKKAAEAAESAAKEAAPEAAESAAEAAETTEDTYTVTKAQMEQMEALAKRWRTPMTNTCGWRRSTTTTGSGLRARRSTCTMTRRSTPSSRFWRCWTTWNGA